MCNIVIRMNKMINIAKPVYAKIYDFDRVTLADEKAFIVRKVDSIEFSCRQHDNAIIWYSGGIRSESFELLPQCRDCVI